MASCPFPVFRGRNFGIMQTPFRPEPKAGPGAYETFQILAPRQTHTRVATCAEVECEQYANGWTTRIDGRTDLGARQAKYIVEHSGRHFTASTAGTLVTFTFPAGQRCFREHRVSLERVATFRRLPGDWRGNPGGRIVTHANATDWRDDMGERLEHIRDERERG
jgi:hypothetical protein